ncbi:MAG: PspC domain-containing protein [Bryobacteraceae bacterium]|mgnify:CR=1 FL=1|nr:PspC domain-containing protein [Bryobacteraceae bacterium]
MYCVKCGRELQETDRYCPQCGLKQGETAAAPRRLTRAMDEKMIAGVCAGFARYFKIDVTLIRIAWLAAVVLAGTGLLAYLICWIVMPKEYGAAATLSRPEAP